MRLTVAVMFLIMLASQCFGADTQVLYPDNYVYQGHFIEFRARGPSNSISPYTGEDTSSPVGHAFVLVGREVDNGGTIYDQAAGFYPEKGKLRKLHGPGFTDFKWADMESEVNFRVPVSAEQARRARAKINKWDNKDYNLLVQNCIHLAREIAADIGLKDDGNALLPLPAIRNLQYQYNRKKRQEAEAAKRKKKKTSARKPPGRSLFSRGAAARKNQLQQRLNSGGGQDDVGAAASNYQATRAYQEEQIRRNRNEMLNQSLNWGTTFMTQELQHRQNQKQQRLQREQDYISSDRPTYMPRSQQTTPLKQCGPCPWTDAEACSLNWCRQR